MTHSEPPPLQARCDPRASGPTGGQKVVQLHPTRRCNLRCLHCYSESGPDVSEKLDFETLSQLITDAAQEGYTVCGVSGGEPLLYGPLPEVLAHAQASGMRTTVTSNGLLLSRARLEHLRPHLDLLAISLDGVPESHNRIRDAPYAFALMAARLEGVRESRVPFGFIFTLTQHNLHELPWVVEFSVREGASLLQIHPLEASGRAVEKLAQSVPDKWEMAMGYVEALRSQSLVADRLRVHVDLADIEVLREEPARGFADSDAETLSRDASSKPLAELVTPLVVQSDGTVLPLQYGFPAAYALGNVRTARLTVLASEWRRSRYPFFRDVCRRVFHRLTSSTASLPIINWYGEIAAEAVAVQQSTPALGATG